MMERIIRFSIEWRALVVLLAAALVGVGIYSAVNLPVDAVPDITTNQVQINAVAPSFTPLENGAGIKPGEKIGGIFGADHEALPELIPRQ
mgnify:CR=1 FL=1